MYLGVVAHVHHEPVKAVRAHCRVERIERRSAGLLRAGAQQKLTHEQQVFLEAADVWISSRLFSWTASVTRCDQPSRRLDARGHETELESQRLVGVALAILFPDDWQELA